MNRWLIALFVLLQVGCVEGGRAPKSFPESAVHDRSSKYVKPTAQQVLDINSLVSRLLNDAPLSCDQAGLLTVNSSSKSAETIRCVSPNSLLATFLPEIELDVVDEKSRWVDVRMLLDNKYCVSESDIKAPHGFEFVDVGSIPVRTAKNDEAWLARVYESAERAGRVIYYVATVRGNSCVREIRVNGAHKTNVLTPS